MVNSVITSYAILKVNWEQPERRDYLDNYVLIIAEAVRQLPDEIVTLSDVQKKVHESFGLEIPQNTINSLLKRVKEHGYLKIINGAYRKVDLALEKLNFHQIQQNVLRAHETLLESLTEFVAKTYDTTWTNEDAENILQAYLQEHHISAPISELANFESVVNASQDKKINIL